MAIKKTQMTGRSKTSWKSKYMELRDRYEKLLEGKVNNHSSKLEETDKKEVGVESPTSLEKEKSESVGNELSEPTPQTQPKKSLPAKVEGSGVEQKDASQSKEELNELEKEKDEDEKLDIPDDEEENEEKIPENPDEYYNFKCSECGAYFMELKDNCCPNCNEEMEE